MNDTDQPVRRRRSSSKLFWMVLATALVLVSAAALSFWVPYQQRQTIVADFAKRGGVASTRSGSPRWLREYLDDDQLRVFNDVVTLDLVKANVDDNDVELLLKLPRLQAVALYGPELTDEGLLQLAQLTELRSMMLVNCPKISASGLAQVRAARPELQIARRGNALLGIAGSDDPDGCLIVNVAPRSGAQTAGLSPGDIITAVDDRPVTGYESLTDLLLSRQPGEKVRLTLAKKSAVLTGALFDVPQRTIEATLTAWR